MPAPGLTYTLGDSTFTHGPLGTPQGGALPEAGERRRIAFVGDSVCYGFYASGEANLTRRVEAALGTGAWETLNFGVPGYNAHMVSATLREQALGFHPAAVVYVFHQNDLTNATWADAYRARPALFRERYDLPAPLWKRSLERSRALTWVLDRARRSPPATDSAGAAPSAAPRELSPYAAALRRLLLEATPQRAYFAEHLSAMRAACEAEGVAFALLFVPREETLALDGEGAYRAALAGLCAERGVTFLDAQAPFASAREALYGDAAHPNARGHALLAAATLPWVRKMLR